MENWAINPSFFYLNQRINNEGDFVKYYFKTDQGLEIQEILDTCTLRKIGKDENAIQKIKNDYPEKFRKNYQNFLKRAFSSFSFKNEY